MAGYDFSFEIPARYREDARNWLRYFQHYATTLNLKVSYRTRQVSRGRAEAYVTVDGPLPAMQHLNRQLPQAAIHFVRAVGKPTTLAKRVLGPFFEANANGVQRITEWVFEAVDDLRGKPAPLSMSANLLEKAEVKPPRSRVDQAFQTIVRTLDGWISGTFSPKDTVILCDQGMEDWLKARLALPVSSREGFHQVIDRAVQDGLISRMEAYRLRRFHSTRNRVQHRGGRVRARTVWSMLSYFVRLIDSHN